MAGVPDYLSSAAIEPGHVPIVITPFAAVPPTFGTPRPPVTTLIAPLGWAPLGWAPIAIVAPIPVAPPVAIIIPAITPPAVMNLDDIALRGHCRPVGWHGTSGRNGRESRARGNGSGKNNMRDLHGSFLIDHEDKMQGRG